MSANDGHIARPWFLVVQRNVLFDSKLQFIILMVCGCAWVFAYMRCGERVLLYPE